MKIVCKTNSTTFMLLRETNLMRPLTARLEVLQITVAIHRLIIIIRFVVKSYTHPWKDFANKLCLVLYTCEILFSRILCDRSRSLTFSTLAAVQARTLVLPLASGWQAPPFLPLKNNLRAKWAKSSREPKLLKSLDIRFYASIRYALPLIDRELAKVVEVCTSSLIKRSMPSWTCVSWLSLRQDNFTLSSLVYVLCNWVAAQWVQLL